MAYYFCYFLSVLATPIDQNTSQSENQNLRTDYKQRIEQAEGKWESSLLKKELTPQRLEALMNIAYQIAVSFQRAYSQTESRNGDLAFVNHAHRGMSSERLKVLTVIH